MDWGQTELTDQQAAAARALPPAAARATPGRAVSCSSCPRSIFPPASSCLIQGAP